MSIPKTIGSALLIGALAALLVGCGAAPASPTTEPPAAIVQPTQPAAQDASKPAPAANAAQTSEVGYKIGMRTPDFGMTLADGTRLTNASLMDEGKPVFLYFHASW